MIASIIFGLILLGLIFMSQACFDNLCFYLFKLHGAPSREMMILTVAICFVAAVVIAWKNHGHKKQIKKRAKEFGKKYKKINS